MSFVNKQHQDLILDLVLNRISEKQFLDAFPMSREEAKRAALVMLERAARECDKFGVEFGLYLGYHFGFSEEFVNTLDALAIANWHERHEDVVSALAKLRSPTSVGALFVAASAKHPYLDYDEAFALANKAIHALSALQTTDAIERLGELLHDDREVVRSYALKQLHKLAKAATSKSIRDRARHLSGH